VTDDEGHYLGIRASNRDITGLRAAEQEARSSREALARVDRVASMGALTGSIAHELNQPLTGILSNAQAAEILLQGGRCDSPGMAEILADVVSDAKRAGEMIRNLRAVFRQQPVELEPLDVNDVVHDSLTLVRRELASHDVKTSTDLADTLPKVMGSSAQLQQVLINLIMNAVQAMADRDDRSLCIGTSTEPRGHVLLWVLDSGPGLEADRLESVFKGFSSTRPGGMGMGLMICRSIVEAHCGRIWAENGPDGGAKISIALPANKG